MVLIVMYCFLLSTYHYFLGIDIIGMKFFYIMTWSWSCWLADCRNFLWLNCLLNHGEDRIMSVLMLGLLLVAGLMLLCCSLLYFCLLDAHMITQALNEHTISLSRLDCLHFLWKICSCVMYQLYILVQHPL